MAILDVNGINKTFGGLRALQDVNLQVEAGSIHAIIGPNGAGKSTFLNVLVGKLTPDSGQANFNGHSLLGMRPHDINQLGVARVFQTPEIFGELNVEQNIMIPLLTKRGGAFALDGHNILSQKADVVCATAEAMEDVGLLDFRHHMAESLSRGDKRRLELAMCLVQRPKLLLLDEPTAGMSRHDTNTTIDLLKKIHGRGMTKVVIEHDMHVVFSLSSRISVLAQGMIIAEGTPDEVRNSDVVKEAYLGGHQDE